MKSLYRVALRTLPRNDAERRAVCWTVVSLLVAPMLSQPNAILIAVVFAAMGYHFRPTIRRWLRRRS